MLFSGVLIEPPTAWHRRGYRSAPELVLHLPALARCSANHLLYAPPPTKGKIYQNKTWPWSWSHSVWSFSSIYNTVHFIFGPLRFFHLILSSSLWVFFFSPDFLCPSAALYFIFLTFRALQFVEPRVSRCNGDNLITMTSLEWCHSMFVGWQVIALCSHGSPVTLIQAQPPLSQTRGQWFSHNYGANNSKTVLLLFWTVSVIFWVRVSD